MYGKVAKICRKTRLVLADASFSLPQVDRLNLLRDQASELAGQDRFRGGT